MPLRQRGEMPQPERDARRFKARVATTLANYAKSWYLKGFREGGGRTDTGRWPPRSGDSNSTRALLVKSGALRRSLDVRRATFDRILISTEGVPYAEYHNEGTERLPQREFLGKSTALEKALKRLIIKELNKAFNGGTS